jgi:hypothetical protein
MQTRTDLSLAGRIAAHTRWAHEPDRTAATQPARDGFMARFENEVDPGRLLDPVERAKRATSAKSAYFARLALASARARKRS